MISRWSITFSVVGLVALSHRMICTCADSDCSRLRASGRVQSTPESAGSASCDLYQHLRVLGAVVNAYLPMAVSRAVSVSCAARVVAKRNCGRKLRRRGGHASTRSASSSTSAGVHSTPFQFKCLPKRSLDLSFIRNIL